MRHEFQLARIETLHEHEEIEPDRVDALMDRMRQEGVVMQPILVDAKTLVVIDGHHRLNALRRLGARRVPVFLVDYHDPAITVTSWRAGDPIPTKDEIVAMALSGRKYPPKSTRHPGLYDLGHVRVQLADLL